MNRKILQLALPNIITNITVPLLGMVDTAIVGHLSESHIGAIAIGTQIFNLIYWNFGFLRMGTSGFTAQAYGAHRLEEAVRVFIRAFAIALAIALLLIILQYPIALLSEAIFNGSTSVIAMALSYFYIRIWAAPATLGLYAIKGWFIGMQNSRLPMWIAIFINVINIICSLLFVLVFKMDIQGVALGTVIAQYSGLAIGLFFMVFRYGKIFRRRISTEFIVQTLRWKEMKQFFKVNGDIFLRTVCLAAVFTFITSESGRISDEILAVDALLMQFFMLFSYIMDGFAYAGESLVGRYIGARDRVSLVSTVRHLMGWGLGLTLLFTLLYAIGGTQFLSIFSDKENVIEATRPYLFWVLIIPVCGFSAFLFDGIFVGATASRTMRNSMFIATATFFLIYYTLTQLLQVQTDFQRNNMLWSAFMVYLAARGIGQAFMLKRDIYGRVKDK
ncbi:MAG: MATE family efflux transporter [Bacteroidales bacterium]|nr:MATE family efflux transporter [Bacteroidales bacterium]MBP5516989.1 MATE family efflux transporter [Bacteroidales bacterium]